MQRRPLLTATLTLIAGLSTTGFAQAQATDWPNRPIHWVVPFPPGGAMDAIARILGDKAGKTLGQPFVIENRAGAGGNIGADAVAKSPADGYTIMHIVTVVALAGPPLGSSLQLRPRSEMPVPLTLARSCVASTIAGKPHCAAR